MSNSTVAFSSTLAPSAPISVPSTSNAPSPNTPTTVIQTTSVPPTTIGPPTASTPDTPTPNPPSPTPAPPESTTPVAGVPVVSTSIITQPSDNDGGNSNNGGSQSGPQTVLITSTASSPTFPKDTNTHTTSSHKSSSTSSGAAALRTSGADRSNDGGGLPTGGRIAVAVVVPIVAVALIVLGALFYWRKRKQRKDAEELRRKEVEEYGFNPNNDPTLPAVGGASSNGDDPSEMRETDGAGYRGWGTTSTNRKQSATLSSGNGGIGIARSGSGSDPGGYHAQSSPTAGTNQSSDVHSGDPLVANGRPPTADSETIGALGNGPVANGNRQDREIHRGPSNASSAYSGGHRSDTSGDGGGAAGQQYYREYYDEAMPQHGPYGDGTYGGGQPVIRDVPARRNTRIENPSVFPQQGSSVPHFRTLDVHVDSHASIPDLPLSGWEHVFRQQRLAAIDLALPLASCPPTSIPIERLRKFGKHLQKRQLDIPEYAASFVNYKALKKVLSKSEKNEIISSLTARQLIKQLSATPTLLARNASSPVIDPQVSLQANKATFFFRLERELEKVNAFYLQKEAELKLRLKTLLDKKRMMQVRNATAPKISASFITLEEGFQQFGTDLSKLQSRTKELYLSRAVEVQPCFNRDVISDLSDQATTSLLELGAWADGDKVQYEAAKHAEHIVSGQSIGTDENDTDSQILQATNAGNLAVLQDWVTRFRESPDARIRFTRTFLGAISDASEEALHVLLASGLVDLHAEDEINGRNCLHEAAISGVDFVLGVGIKGGIELDRVDVYGRIPLHYACMRGRVGMVQTLVDTGPETLDLKDHDNFTPLIHGVVHHQLACVEQLLSHGSRLDPDSESDHVPLNLACQHGSIAITQLLLERGAQILPDAEGLFPQHLVARSGRSSEMLLMLEKYGADLDQRDKLYQWTPLFHAAAEGRVDCLKALLERGVDVRILDEKNLSAMYYATWEGHLECMDLLSSTGTGTQTMHPLRQQQQEAYPVQAKSMAPTSMAFDTDGIPDLSLPPPIIPLRRYGHNFLDSKTFVLIAFEEESISFYHDSKYPAARLTISSKTRDIIPRNLMLPIQEDSKIISFQIDRLESFILDFDIYPTFGSKIIARNVALPNLFSAVSSSSGTCCLPLFDPRLRAIGQISFSYQVITPFRGMPLEITQFATYWKATSQLDTHPSALITGSSLSGDYAQIFVQVTKDGVPVVYPRWSINYHGVEFPINRMTYRQYLSLGSEYGRGDQILAPLAEAPEEHITKIHDALADCFAALKDIIQYLPPSIHINIHVLYPTAAQEQAFDLMSPTPNINDYADAILKDVFDHARNAREQHPDSMRSLVFTSYNPDICTALNWKQPNYPVLLCNDLGAIHDPASNVFPSSDGHNSISVKEAVRIAQSNNFMGLVCSARLMRLVPALIESIKVAGLVLVTDMSEEEEGQPGREYRMLEGVDGLLKGNGVLRFNEMIDM
ncbi:MAG: hypothetical protein Q9225_004138 [Loekoesia sp. 1 TL-2023]